MTANVPERLEWSGKNGAEERFFCMTAEPGASFEEELQSLMARYRNLGGGEEDEFLLRFHVSDPVRQSAPLRQITGERNSYVSIVGQPPANGARVALEAWHIGGMLGKRRRSRAEQSWKPSALITVCSWRARGNFPPRTAAARCGRNSAGWTGLPPYRGEPCRI